MYTSKLKKQKTQLRKLKLLLDDVVSFLSKSTLNFLSYPLFSLSFFF